jgi:hypothetical protein
MKETYSSFNGYVDTGFHLKVTAFISVTSVYDFSGEGPPPPYRQYFSFVDITNQPTNKNWQQENQSVIST